MSTCKSLKLSVSSTTNQTSNAANANNSATITSAAQPKPPSAASVALDMLPPTTTAQHARNAALHASILRHTAPTAGKMGISLPTTPAPSGKQPLLKYHQPLPQVQLDNQRRTPIQHQHLQQTQTPTWMVMKIPSKHGRYTFRTAPQHLHPTGQLWEKHQRHA